MNIRNKPPVFLPVQYHAQTAKLTKAVLLDMAWDMAKQLTPPADDGGEAPDSDVIGTFWHIATIVKNYRTHHSQPAK